MPERRSQRDASFAGDCELDNADRSQRDASFAGDCELDNADCTLVIYYAAEASAKVGKIITDARYDGKGTLAMRLAKDVELYLVGLTKCYTQYRLRNILDLPSGCKRPFGFFM